MKILSALLVVLTLVGCSTIVPVAQKFPEAPNTLLEKCSDLKKTDEDAKLSDVAKTIVENYTQYQYCSMKTNAWIEWYNSQKKIFKEIK
jgi:uncharacterized protein YceK